MKQEWEYELGYTYRCYEQSVEFFDIGAIADAIARSGYQREAIWGTLTGLTVVGSISAALGTGLQLIPIHLLQVVIDGVLLWFGWGWYKKSIR